MAITCLNCGTELPNTANFCLNCGLPLQGDLHRRDIRAFLKAIETINFDIVEQLLEQDVRLANIRDNSIYRYTALHYAVAIGAEDADKAYEMVDLLITYGAEVNPPTERTLRTPLHNAVGLCLFKDNGSVVKLLLNYGANPNAQDAEGNTPLHSAVGFTGMDEAPTQKCWVATDLCNAGANPLIANNESETPLSKIEKTRKLFLGEPPTRNDSEDWEKYDKRMDEYYKRQREILASETWWIYGVLRGAAGIKTEE